MSRALTFNTLIDRQVRHSGLTRKKFAENAHISASTLLKARGHRGPVHWTTLVLIGAQLGIFRTGESITVDDPRLNLLIPRRLRSSRGRGAPHWYDYQ